MEVAAAGSRVVAIAELVGLVVLERHQLFEPVHAKVSGMETRIDRFDTTMSTLAETLGAWDQVTVCASPPEALRALTRIKREALAREHETPGSVLIGHYQTPESGRIEAEAGV